jgi:hypothetical protein
MAEEFNRDFQLLPADGRDLTADEQLASVLRTPSLEADAQTEVLPLGRSWAFDFQAGQFVRHGLAPAEVHDVEALRVWIEATLRTARFAHPIFSDQYGLEDVGLVGTNPDPATIGLYADSIRTALEVHDRITSVRDFKFTRDANEDSLFVEFTVVVDTGDLLTIDAINLGAIAS